MSSEPVTAIAVPRTEEAPAGSAEYRMSAAGRRTAGILLLGVIAVAIFAVWTLVTQAEGGLSGPEWVTAALMLGILALAPVVGWNLLEERAATITTDPTGLTYRSLSGIELRYSWPEVTGLDPAPPAPSRWARLFFDNPASDATPADLAHSPTAGPKAGLTNHISSNNAPLTVPRDESPAGAGPPRPPAEAEDRAQDVVDAEQRTIPVRVSPPPAARLPGPVTRALWRQAHGATLPLPAGLDGRAALIATIRAHLAPRESPPPA
jgi:hypothetical protein